MIRPEPGCGLTIGIELSNFVKYQFTNRYIFCKIKLCKSSSVPFSLFGELQQLIKVLALRVGNKLDYTKLSQVVGISRPTLSEYLEFLEKTYVIFRLPAYAGPDKAAVLGKSCTSAITGSPAFWPSLEKGHCSRTQFIINWQLMAIWRI